MKSRRNNMQLSSPTSPAFATRFFMARDVTGKFRHPRCDGAGFTRYTVESRVSRRGYEKIGPKQEEHRVRRRWMLPTIFPNPALARRDGRAYMPMHGDD
jgi:hypothetical protein